MPARTAEAEWNGDLMEGRGRVKLGGGAFDGAYDFRSRFADGVGTNPEELIAAAHAGCYSMALSAGLGKDGHPPTRVHTTATVHLGKQEGGFVISSIDLVTEAEVPGLTAEEFQRQAEQAKVNCPVSKALAAVSIHLTAKLL